MGFGTNQQNVTTGSVFIPTNWSKELEIAREANQVMQKLVNRRDFDAQPAGGTINVPFISNLVANAISSNGQASFQAPTETSVSVSLNRYFESSFAVEYRLDKQSAYDSAMQYKNKVSYALNQQIETDLLGLYSSATQTVGTGSSAITEAEIVSGLLDLDNANAPAEDRAFVVAPSTMSQLRQISRYTDYQTTGEKISPNVGGNGGLVGNVSGVPVYMTTNVIKVTGTPTTTHNLLFQKSFATLAIQKEISVMVEDRPSYFATGYIASVLYGFALLRADHMVDCYN